MIRITYPDLRRDIRDAFPGRHNAGLRVLLLRAHREAGDVGNDVCAEAMARAASSVALTGRGEGALRWLLARVQQFHAEARR